jgi:hypothetical protein
LFIFLYKKIEVSSFFPALSCFFNQQYFDSGIIQRKWRSDDGLIAEKIKAEVYLGSMESKHTTRFTRKKRAKK